MDSFSEQKYLGEEWDQLRVIKVLACLDQIYVTGALGIGCVHSNKTLCVMYTECDSWWCEHLNFTVGVCLSIILLWGIICFQMIRFRACVVCGGGGSSLNSSGTYSMMKVDVFTLNYICTSHLAFTSHLPVKPNLINQRNQSGTSWRTCKTGLLTNSGDVINHVEIKVKGEGLNLSSES